MADDGIEQRGHLTHVKLHLVWPQKPKLARQLISSIPVLYPRALHLPITMNRSNLLFILIHHNQLIHPPPDQKTPILLLLKTLPQLRRLLAIPPTPTATWPTFQLTQTLSSSVIFRLIMDGIILLAVVSLLVVNPQGSTRTTPSSPWSRCRRRTTSFDWH